MTIDWTLAKPGALAVHRNGGRSVIERYSNDSTPMPHCLRYKEAEYRYWYYDDGRADKGGSPFDIIEIIQAPEPKRETVMLYWNSRMKQHCISTAGTHSLIFDTLDGEPVLDSVKMEKL